MNERSARHQTERVILALDSAAASAVAVAAATELAAHARVELLALFV